MSQNLLISLKKNICKRDIFFDCIYTERSDVGDLLSEWMRYSAINKIHIAPLKIMIRDWVFFDKFMDDFSRIKDFCPRVSSFNDVWIIQDLSNMKIIHISAKEDKYLKGLLGGIMSDLDDPGSFTSRDAID